MTDEPEGGRVFFSNTGRSLVDEDEIVVLSVGVDIGSSTSHLVFSRIVLERLDSRYIVTTREAFYQSEILLTPYAAEEEIDADALGAFIEQQYQKADVDPDEIDTGALILTGVAVRRKQRARDRRAVRAPGRQDGGGVGRRQSRDRDGGARLGRGCALDPRQGDRDERRRRRRHLEDRGLRRGPRHRAHRARCRRAARLPRRRRPHRARRRSRAAVRGRPRHRARHRRPACTRTCAGAGGAHGRLPVRGDARRPAVGRRLGAAAARPPRRRTRRSAR